ncbi:MAG: DMT family transporter [Eubacterium sp.]|nr:DMT family transporter [Eubacterium sp.]
MDQKKAQLLMAAVIVSRSVSYLFTKFAMQSMEIFNILGVRFLLAFLILAVIFRRKLRALSVRALLRGAILGGLLFAIMALELTALKTTDTSTTSFLENTAIIFVPLFTALLERRFPDRDASFHAVLAVAGIGLMTLVGAGFVFTPGEIMVMCGALLYASEIILIGKYSREDDPLTLGIIQIGVLGALAMVFSFLFEVPRLPQTGMEWSLILLLALLCTSFGFALQPVAQRHISPERAGMFCALSPVSAMIAGTLILHEAFTPFKAAGAALILASILLPPLPERRHRAAVARQ